MKTQNPIVPVEVSARHIHLSQKDLEKLFGQKYKLNKLRDLSQKGEFAAVEILTAGSFKLPLGKVMATSPKGGLNDGGLKLRVLGPVRKETQVELAQTDVIKLGVEAPLAVSGDLKRVKPVLEVGGPKGKIMAKAIVAKRHLHCSPADAKKLNLKNGQLVKIEIVGERGLIFNNVVVRIAPKMVLSCHIDTDEANAAGLGKICGSGFLIVL
jgi:putative phosphotransacetylase